MGSSTACAGRGGTLRLRDSHHLGFGLRRLLRLLDHRYRGIVGLGDQVAAAAAGSLRQIGLDQLGHVVVAGAAGLAAHHHRDDAALAVADRRNQVEARGARIAGLDAVHALHSPEQAVVIGHALAAIGEGAGREVAVILREMLAQRHAEDRQVARRRMLLRIRQPRGVAEDRAAHAELARLGRHDAREIRLPSRRAIRRSPRPNHWPTW